MFYACSWLRRGASRVLTFLGRNSQGCDAKCGVAKEPNGNGASLDHLG
jgi:hypothetical protein